MLILFFFPSVLYFFPWNRSSNSVELAVYQSEEGFYDAGNDDDDEDDDDPNDPSKLSLAERVKLFSEKMIHARLPPTSDPPRSKRSNRFKTQPVTSFEVVSAQKSIPIMNQESSAVLGVNDLSYNFVYYFLILHALV